MASKQDVSKELEFQAHVAESAGEVRATPESTLRRYREHKRWRTSNKEFIFHAIAKYSPKHICDFGCGAGETSTELAVVGYRVTGFDVSPELIEMARQRGRLDKVEDRTEFIVADAHTADWSKYSFDLVLVQGVLHHVDVKQCLETLHSLLKPGGIAVIQEPVAFSRMLQWFRDRVPVPKDISPNERQLNQEDMRLIESRFEVIEKRHFHFFTRLARLVPSRWEGMVMLAHHVLGWIDYLLLTAIPPLGRFAGIIVLVGRKPGK